MRRAAPTREFNAPPPIARPSLSAAVAREGYSQDRREPIDIRRLPVHDDTVRPARAEASPAARPAFQEGYRQAQPPARDRGYAGNRDVLSWEQEPPRAVGRAEYPPEAARLQQVPPRAMGRAEYPPEAARLQQAPPRVEIREQAPTSEVARLQQRIREQAALLDRAVRATEKLNYQTVDLRKAKTDADNLRFKAEGELKRLNEMNHTLAANLRLREKEVTDKDAIIQGLRSRVQALELELSVVSGGKPVSAAAHARPREASPLRDAFNAVTSMASSWMGRKESPARPPSPLVETVLPEVSLDEYQRRLAVVENDIAEEATTRATPCAGPQASVIACEASIQDMREAYSNVSSLVSPVVSFRDDLIRCDMLDRVKVDIQKKRQAILRDEICHDSVLDELIAMVQYPAPASKPGKNQEIKLLCDRSHMDIQDFMDCVEPDTSLGDLVTLVNKSQCNYDQNKDKFFRLYVRQYMNLQSTVKDEFIRRLQGPV